MEAEEGDGMTVTTYQGDCLQIMKDLPDKSVDLVIMDPPYYRIMVEDYARQKYDWDTQWDSIGDYEDWILRVFQEVKRLCTPTASIYCFADDIVSAHVQIQFEKCFNILNNIIWYKPNNMTIKGWSGYRKYVPVTERILFGEMERAPGMPATGLEMIHSDPQCFEPIRSYFVKGKQKCMEEHGWNTEQFNEWINGITGTRSVASRHYFAVSQYTFPTKEIYEKMRATGYWTAQYEELRQQYEELRRPFRATKLMTDIWTFPICSPSEDRIHPTQKPKDLIARILSTSTRGGEPATVLDPFMGSGVVGCECMKLNLDYIGIEQDSDMKNRADSRIFSTERMVKVRTRLEDFS